MISKYKYFKYLFPLSLAICLGWIGLANELENKVQENLQKWKNVYAAEKVYLHHDKSYYAAGQEIWFKGYIVNASDLRPSDKSQVLYIDFLDQDNNPIQQITVPAVNGKASGNISLPDQLETGVYRLSAYTQWQNNFGEAYFFRKDIQVFGQSIPSPSSGASEESLDLQFFPEGGDLVNGIQSRIAFKAIRNNGKGVPVQGVVLDDQGNKIIDFEDEHLGMGSFLFRPEAKHEYFAQVTGEDGETMDFPLPKPLETGYALQIDEVENHDQLEITVAGNLENPEKLALVAISEDELHFYEEIDGTKEVAYKQQIPKSRLPTGITRFHLAKVSGEPLAERLVFIQHPSPIQLHVQPEKSSYAPREAIDLQIEATDYEGNPISTDFSLAVTDAQLAGEDPFGSNIFSYFLLSSELKGSIEQPGFYFEEDGKEKDPLLRNLLLTHGWRRFGWNQIVKDGFPEIEHRPEIDLTLRGKLTNTRGGPVPNGEVILFLKDQANTFITTESDEQGDFAFEGFYFMDTIELIIQGSDARGRTGNVQVQMETERFSPPLSTSRLLLESAAMESVSIPDFLASSEQQIASTEEELASLTLGEILLEGVIVEGRAEPIQTMQLHRRADAVIKANQLPVAPSGNILQSLQGRVAGLQITQTGPTDFKSTIRNQGTPLYLLDGIPISEGTAMVLNQFDIERVEVIRNIADAAIYGGRAAGGVIAFYTKRGQLEEVEPDSNPYIISHRAGGFQKEREFYHPKYADTDTGIGLPDTRTTLYWNPAVKTDEDGKANVRFYAADRTTTYRTIIEGISDNGDPVKKMDLIEIKNTN